MSMPYIVLNNTGIDFNLMKYIKQKVICWSNDLIPLRTTILSMADSSTMKEYAPTRGSDLNSVEMVWVQKIQCKSNHNMQQV